ncbi:hypothetical protein NZD89_25095 [Alicyclobacillus fastidiosus]|uniref:BZIP domain-containing protein n=1 Tax=Alicyclobacillus fastidiosus TaxID=392011 RepID=A0ABY6ZH73_9BACL|nr:hypothetical protein [Alicyclobacillus fastidiosus]WAH41480.1 hypothetical protein NZD89_25095 [Alicyclobacillus fastidiosus]GMA63122.1 hypothetical protein GCM10025859_35620 [Alicyclobacillus fastidiosus]
MARFERLRWVPMLIRAYYEAQARASKQAVSEPFVQSPAKETSQNARFAPVHRGKTMKSAVRIRAERPKKPAQAVTKNANRRPRSNAAANRRLLEELQSANRKLEELTTLQQQIREIGTSLDGFHKEISELKTKADESLSRRRPDRLNSGPMALPHMDTPPYGL